MARHVRPEDTSYSHKNSAVTWKGIDGAGAFACHTDCSGFINALLRRAYGFTDNSFRVWLATRRPLAKAYYEAVVAHNRFVRIPRVTDVEPGDVIAVRYPADDQEIDLPQPEEAKSGNRQVAAGGEALKARRVLGTAFASTSIFYVLDYTSTLRKLLSSARRPAAAPAPSLPISLGP